jgi:hypothetical protein
LTLTQIIAKSAERYTTNRTSLLQGSAICDIQRQLYVKLGILKPQSEEYKTTTIASQTSYSLPSDCRIENVWAIMVEKTVGSANFEEYTYAPFFQEDSYGNFYTRGASDSIFYLFKNGLPIATTGLEIIIYYYPRPVNFDGSDLSVTPALDTDFHDYFWMMLIQDNASCGDYPDISIAKAWRSEADAYFLEIKKSMIDRMSAASNFENQAKESW